MPISPECLVVIYAKEPALLGKRFVLERSSTLIGRGVRNDIALDADAVSRRHARVERRHQRFYLLERAAEELDRARLQR